MTHIERMKDEIKELKERISKLKAFVFSNPTYKTLDDTEQVRMVRQLAFMEAYMNELDGRIWTAQSTSIPQGYTKK